MFSKYGQVSDVYIPVDYYTRRFRGFAYIQYPYLTAFCICYICSRNTVTEVILVVNSSMLQTVVIFAVFNICHHQ